MPPPSPELKKWQRRIELSRRFQKHRGRVNRWRRMWKYYRNDFPNMDDLTPVNITFGVGRALIPQIYFKTPAISIRARKPEFQQNVRLIEEIDNFILKKIRLKEQLKLLITDVWVTGIGVLKFGYDSLYTGTRGEETQMDMFTRQVEGTALGDVLKQANEEDRIEYHDLVSKEMPWALRWNPEDFLIEPGVRDLESAQWCAFYTLRPIEDIKADESFNNTANLKATRTHRGLNRKDYFATTQHAIEFRDDQIELAGMYEIFDKRTGRVQVMAEGHDLWLRNEKYDLPIEGFPVEILSFNQTGDEFYPESDATYILNQQDELNDIRTHQNDHRRTASLKGAYDKNRMDEEEVTRLESGKVLPFVGVDGPPGDAISFYKPEMSRSLFEMDETIMNDVRLMTGFSRNQEGDFEPGSRTTATEARIVQAVNELRSDERRDIMADFLGRSIEKINQMIFHFWDAPRAIQVGGTDGDWVEFTGSQIKGEYEIEVIPDSLLPLTRAVEKFEARELATVAMNFPVVQASLPAQIRIMSMLAKAHREIVDEEQFIAELSASLQQMQQGVGDVQPGGGPEQGAV